MADLTTITLTTPLATGGEPIESLRLRRPSAGELRGLRLLDVINMDVGALLTLVPRIAEPHVTEAQLAALTPADLVAVAEGVAGFFMGSPPSPSA